MPEKPKSISTNHASGGTGTHVVRYTLVISTVPAIAALVWVWLAAPKATDPGMETASAAARQVAIPPLPVPR